MRIILQKFGEKILYGFAFGTGMGFSWQIFQRSKKHENRWMSKERNDTFSLKNCNRSYRDLNPDCSDQNRKS